MQTHLTVKGLVLRETAFGEADKLFDLLTDDGILTVRARSVRKPGAKYAAVTQAFSYGEFCLRTAGQQTAQQRFFLDSAVPLEMFFGLRTSLPALSLAAYCSEVVRKTAARQKQPQILRLFLLSLHHLSEQDRSEELVKAVFELRIASLLGFPPNLLCCAACGEFLPEKPVLRIAERDFVCADCLPEPEPEPAEPPYPPPPVFGTAGVLQAARHILFAEENRLFQFRLADSACRILSDYTERYLQHCTECSFRSLRFYKETAL